MPWYALAKRDTITLDLPGLASDWSLNRMAVAEDEDCTLAASLCRQAHRKAECVHVNSVSNSVRTELYCLPHRRSRVPIGTAEWRLPAEHEVQDDTCKGHANQEQNSFWAAESACSKIIHFAILGSCRATACRTIHGN